MTSELTRGMTSFALENNYEKTSGTVSFFYNWGKHWINDGYHLDEEPLDYRFGVPEATKCWGCRGTRVRNFLKVIVLTVGFDYFHFGGESWNQPLEGEPREPQVDKTQDKRGRVYRFSTKYQ